MEKTRLRIRFTKTGDLRWISHRDLARVWERLLRRADLQLAFSEGFHPKPRINFPSALALGVEALDELVELELVGEVDLQRIEGDIRRELPAGMELLSLDSPSYAMGKARVEATKYRIRLDEASHVGLQERIAELCSREVISVERSDPAGQDGKKGKRGKTIVCDPRDEHFEMKIDGEYLLFSLPTVAQASIRPSELLDCLGLGDVLEAGEVLQRVSVQLREPPPQGSAVAGGEAGHGSEDSAERNEDGDAATQKTIETN